MTRFRTSIFVILAGLLFASGLLSGATGTLFPNPWFNAFDTNGNPVSGAKACFYTAGTSTPATTYSDVTLLTPNSNPVVADSAGRVGPVYLTPGSSYKLVLQDSTGTAGVCDGAVIRTQDNIAAVPTSSNNVDLTGTAGEAITAGQCVYLSDGSGSKVAGQWYKCDSANTYSSTLAEVGLAPAAIASGATGTIRLTGAVTGLSVTVGSEYFVGTAGAITSTAPSNRRHLGHADSATTLVLTADPQPTPTVNLAIAQGRLTLTTGTCVTTSDVTAATTIFYTPNCGGGAAIALYDGTNWNVRTFAEISIAVPATTSTMYDVFVFDNAGTATLELLAWTNDTTRATALTTQNGVWVKTGATTRRYVGSCRTTTVSGQTEDSAAKRFVWNLNNRALKPVRVSEATASWTYTLATWRQANGSTANQVAIVNGLADSAITVTLLAQSSQSAGADRNVSIGESSTTTVATGAQGAYATGATNFQPMTATLTKMPAVGYVFYVWLESSQAAGVTTWNGTPTSAAAGATSLGLQGSWWC